MGAGQMADPLIIPGVLVGMVSDSRFERGSSSRSRLARHVRSSRPSCPVSSFTGSISPSVMAAALTCLGGDQQLEEDAAQLVFRGLAEKAPTLAKDIPHCTLGFIVMPFTRRRDWHEVNGEGPNQRRIMLALPWTKQMLMQSVDRWVT